MITKVVIPAAGLGTRFLPVTKSMPKEMLPIIDKPAIHYVVEEAVASGIEDIIIITGRGKRAIEDYFDSSPELESYLEYKGKRDELNALKELEDFPDIHYIRQHEPSGLGDAVLKAEQHIGDDAFAVMLGDDIIYSPDVPCIRQLMQINDDIGTQVVAVNYVPNEESHKYGMIAGDMKSDNLFKIKHIVEKPKSHPPSNLGAVGRYVFHSSIFDIIKELKPGVGGEIQLADAINVIAATDEIYAYKFAGHRYDVGDKLGYLKTIVEFAMRDERINKEFMEYLAGNHTMEI
jgi:UTP--glucose-1-phosphate uridylyltransferase